MLDYAVSQAYFLIPATYNELSFHWDRGDLNEYSGCVVLFLLRCYWLYPCVQN